MSTTTVDQPRFTIKEPKFLSERARWLRDYYFTGVQRKWNNEFTSWTTGTPGIFSITSSPFTSSLKLIFIFLPSALPLTRRPRR